jgi:hypothetical protein
MIIREFKNTINTWEVRNNICIAWTKAQTQIDNMPSGEHVNVHNIRISDLNPQSSTHNPQSTEENLVSAISLEKTPRRIQ